MDPYKLQRQNAALRKVLAELVSAEVKDPRVGFVTINGVELSRDQTSARVLFSVMGEAQERRDSLAGLKKARGFLQSRLSDILRLRNTPDLRFEYDDSVDRSLAVEDILADLEDAGEFEDEATRNRRRDLESLMPPRDLMAALDEAERVWVAPHWNPDPDAMGSALALGAALAAGGRDVTVLAHPDAPKGFASLPGYADALPAPEAAARLAESPPDTLLVVDCHHLDRVGDALAPVLADIPRAWCIDHHLISDGPAPLPGWIEAVASSASLLVLRVIETLAADDPRVEVTPDIATNIYAGLYADTGGFRFPNTLPMTFAAAGAMAARGVDVAAVAEQMLHLRTRPATELLRRVMASFEFHADGRILSLYADRTMMAETGTSMSDTEGFVGLATGTEGVRFVIFLKEREDGLWRVSLRARAGGDVQRVAASHGGGGHVLASGCTLDGAPADLIADLVADLSAQLG